MWGCLACRLHVRLAAVNETLNSNQASSLVVHDLYAALKGPSLARLTYESQVLKL